METMRERFTDTCIRLLDRDERVAVVLADIGVSRFGLTRVHERVFNVGIREQLMVSFAAGLALEGMVPIVHSYTPFLIERPFEQIKLDLGHQDVDAVLVSIGGSYDAAGEGRTHQAPGDVALMSALPDWSIHAPGHPDEAEEALLQAVEGGGRTYIRLARESNREAHPIGEMTEIVAGARATVLAVGPLLDPVLEAVQGLEVGVLYTPTISPWDGSALGALVDDHIILVEPYLEGTSTYRVASCLDRPVRIDAIGVPNTEHRHYGTPGDHAAGHGLDAAGLRRRIASLL